MLLSHVSRLGGAAENWSGSKFMHSGISGCPQMLNQTSGLVQPIGRTLNWTTGPVRHQSGPNQSLELNSATTILKPALTVPNEGRGKDCLFTLLIDVQKKFTSWS